MFNALVVEKNKKANICWCSANQHGSVARGDVTVYGILYSELQAVFAGQVAVWCAIIRMFRASISLAQSKHQMMIDTSRATRLLDRVACRRSALGGSGEGTRKSRLAGASAVRVGHASGDGCGNGWFTAM